MFKFRPLSLFLLFWLFISFLGIRDFQQTKAEFNIKLNRNFGYGGFGNDIQGLFTIQTSDTEVLTLVTFYIDEIILGIDTFEPFSYQFNTTDFSAGKHEIFAVGITTLGEERRSNSIFVNFISGAEARNRAILIVGVILSIVLGGMLLSAFIAANFGKNRRSSPASVSNYGLLGGTVCPSCEKPYQRHWWGINLIVGKLDRCPNCGSWRITRRATNTELIESQNNWAIKLDETRASNNNSNEVEEFKRQLDDSKYMN